PLVSTLQAFGVFFIGFVARPIGAAIFGHYGDRIGRKATLIVTLLMTGIATAAVGLVPGYATIGIWGAIILTVLRLIQGIGVGGEWGGSVLLAMEWARTNKNRGFIASWPQFGAPAGLFLANIMVLLFSWISGDQFLTWGWRIPFLLSIVMIAVGLWIRLGILETPTFQRILAENKVERAHDRGAQAPTARSRVDRPVTPRRAVLLLRLQRLRVHLRHARVGSLPRSTAVGPARQHSAGVHYGPDRRCLVRPRRPPPDIHDRLRVRCAVHLRVFRTARYENAGPYIPCGVPVVHPGDDDVRPAGGADRRGIYAATAL